MLTWESGPMSKIPNYPFNLIRQPARSLMTALTAVYTQLFDKCLIIKHAFPKKRKSSMTVNNNAGQRLNLRDVYKVMEMRDCPAQSDTSGHPFIDHKHRLGP